MPDKKETDYSQQINELMPLVERLGVLNSRASSALSKERLPTTDPNQFWHALDCNLHTLTVNDLKYNESQKFKMEDAVRIQFVSEHAESIFIVDLYHEGTAVYIYLNQEVSHKERSSFKKTEKVISFLKSKIMILEKYLGISSGDAIKPEKEEALTREQASELVRRLESSVKKGVVKGIPSTLCMPRLKKEFSALKIDLTLLYRALKVEITEDQNTGLIRFLQAVAEGDDLDRFASVLAEEALASGLKSNVKWMLDAAGALGGDGTAIAIGNYVWEKLKDSHAHNFIVHCLQALESMGTKSAVHEIFTVESIPSRYAKRKNEAKEILEKLSVLRMVSSDELIAWAVPAGVTGKALERVRQVQSRRLERMMVDGGRVPYRQFVRLFLELPLLSSIVHGVIWGKYGAGEKLAEAFYVKDRAPISLSGNVITLADDDPVGIVHPVEFEPDVIEKWKRVFKIEKIDQPFLQLNRTTYALTEKQKASNEIMDFKHYDREWLHEQEWWGFKEDADYMSDVDTFAVVMKRDKKHIEAKLDGTGAIYKIAMGHVKRDYNRSQDGYLSQPDDPTPFGKLHPVSQSELVYALLGQKTVTTKRTDNKQTGKYPFLEKAKTGRSTCVACGEKIEKDAFRVGLERMIETTNFTGLGTVYLHAAMKCVAGCEELKDIADIEQWLEKEMKRFPADPC